MRERSQESRARVLALRQQIENGEYRVEPAAVAEAILRRVHGPVGGGGAHGAQTRTPLEGVLIATKLVRRIGEDGGALPVDH